MYIQPHCDFPKLWSPDTKERLTPGPSVKHIWYKILTNVDFFRLNKPHSYLEKVTTLNRRFLRRDIFYHDLLQQENIFRENIHNNLKIPFIIPPLWLAVQFQITLVLLWERDIKFGFYLTFNYRNGHVLRLRLSLLLFVLPKRWRCSVKSIIQVRFVYSFSSTLEVSLRGKV